jgi:hypothetical protein
LENWVNPVFGHLTQVATCEATESGLTQFSDGSAEVCEAAESAQRDLAG